MMELPDYVRVFMKSFTDSGYEIYLVGGAVRHMLLNQPITDWDFTTNARPEKILQMNPDAFYHNTYGTVTVPIIADDKTHLMEVTPYRREGVYHDSRHPSDIEWADTLQEDLARRDFTINAMAYDGHDIIDLYGGRSDITARRVVTVGDPNLRFAEDALRLMRAVRLCAQLGFLLDDVTRDAMRTHAQTITKISAERIRDELLKIMSAEYPSEGILFMRSTGLLEYVLPELDACFEVPQKSPKRHHVYDVGTHLVMSLKHCPSTDPITRFATLIHDIGKVKTFRQDDTGLITFYNHEVVGRHMADKIAIRLKLSNHDREKLVRLVEHHQFTVSEIQTDRAVRRFIRNVGREYVQDMLDLRTGDRIGGGATPTSWRYELFKKRIEEVQKQPFSVTDLKVNGRDVMDILKIDPSRRVGEILEEIFKKVEDQGLPNEREAQLEAIKSYSA